MIDPEIFPVMDSINLATPEDAQKLSRILNELYDEINRLIHKVDLTRQEMDALWEHVRPRLSPYDAPNPTETFRPKGFDFGGKFNV